MVIDYRKELHILKINFNDFSADFFDPTYSDSNSLFCFTGIVPDQLDHHKFIALYEDRFSMGHVENGDVILGETKRLLDDDINLESMRLVGGKLQGFYFVEDLRRFYEFDLETMEKREIDVGIELDNKKLDFMCSDVSLILVCPKSFKYCIYCKYIYSLSV